MHSDDFETDFTGSLFSQLQDARRLSREYNDLLDVLPDIIYKIDPEGRFVYLSKSIEILGYTREELSNIRVRDVYADPKDQPRFRKEVGRKGYVRDYPFRVRRKDGTIVQTVTTTRVRYADDGSIIGYEGIMRDVTAQRQLEERLRKNEKALKHKTKRLEESNATLQVLLKKVNKDARVTESQIVTNLQELVFPLIKR